MGAAGTCQTLQMYIKGNMIHFQARGVSRNYLSHLLPWRNDYKTTLEISTFQFYYRYSWSKLRLLSQGQGGCSYIFCFASTPWHSAGQLLQGFLGSGQGISHPLFAMADVQWSGSFWMATRAGEDPGLEEKHWGVLALHLMPEGQIGSSQVQN